MSSTCKRKALWAWKSCVFSSVRQAEHWNGWSDAPTGQYVEWPWCKCGCLSTLWCTAGIRRTCLQCCRVTYQRKSWSVRGLQFSTVSLFCRCWKTSGPASWSKSLGSKSRSIRSGSSNCTRTCRNPKTAAKLSESVWVCFIWWTHRYTVMILLSHDY